MPLIIAGTFADSLARLTAQEQAAVKQTAFDLQVSPENPGLSFHRIDKSKDKFFWSVRVNRDIRIILHKRGESVLLAYVDHHDDAYAWAERRRLDVHPRTGAAQLVEVRERVEETVIRRVVEQSVPKPPVLGAETDDTLLDCGVPQDWLDEVRKATEDTLLDICRFLPAEAAEAVLNLAVGIRPPPRPRGPDGDPFEHPDALRSFWKLNDQKGLDATIRESRGKLTVTLGQAQRDFVTRHFRGARRQDNLDELDRDPRATFGLSFRRPRKSPFGDS